MVLNQRIVTKTVPAVLPRLRGDRRRLPRCVSSAWSRVVARARFARSASRGSSPRRIAASISAARRRDSTLKYMYYNVFKTNGERPETTISRCTACGLLAIPLEPPIDYGRAPRARAWWGA
jgi:hypothetical protein